MANGEWLTQLMAGLGGAFTGVTQAKSRMAEEAEAQRKKMELENERARIRRIQQLRSSPLTETSRGELLQLGETPSNIAALQELFTPEKPKTPSYTQRNVGPGRRIMMTDPTTGKSIYAMTPEGQPIVQPRETETERPLSRLERGEGLTFFRRFMSDESLRQNPVEATRRVMMVQELKNQYPGITDEELGQMLMGGSRTSTRFMGGTTGATRPRPTFSLDQD